MRQLNFEIEASVETSEERLVEGGTQFPEMEFKTQHKRA